MCFVRKDWQLCWLFSTVHNGVQHHLYLPAGARVPLSFHLISQAFPVPSSSHCKAWCLCSLLLSFPLSTSQPASRGHPLFRKLLSASMFFILRLDIWFPSFLIPFLRSFFPLSPYSCSSLEVVTLGILPGHTKLGQQEGNLVTFVFSFSTRVVPA